jgi:hypothetical protein
VQTMTTIGSVGSVHYIREVYSYSRTHVDIFFILPDPYSLNGNRHLDHNASIDADFLKEMPFMGVEICKKHLRGQICPPKLKKFLNCCKSMKFLNNF